MFIEVYVIPTGKWTSSSKDSAIPENRKLISLKRIRDVDYSNYCEGRADITFASGDHITVVGTYDEIVERISKVTKLERV